MDDVEVKVAYGTVELRSWLEAKSMPNGEIRLVGMSSAIKRDRAGNIESHKIEPTGIELFWE